MIFKNLENGQIANITSEKLIADFMAKCQDQLDEQGNIIEKATWKEITEEEYLALQPKEVVPTQEEIDKQNRIAEIKTRLDQLSEDIIQYEAGENVPDITKRKAEFIMLHNELRELEGKQPRGVR